MFFRMYVMRLLHHMLKYVSVRMAEEKDLALIGLKICMQRFLEIHGFFFE